MSEKILIPLLDNKKVDKLLARKSRKAGWNDLYFIDFGLLRKLSEDDKDLPEDERRIQDLYIGFLKYNI